VSIYSNNVHGPLVTPDMILNAKRVIAERAGAEIPEEIRIVAQWQWNHSRLERPDDARYHAGEWACGVPGFGQICHGNAKAASYYHRVAIWLGWAWGCAGIWSECDSGLERPDTVEYHAGWFQPLPYGQKRNLRDVHHRTWYGERQAMGCGYPWGCRSWDDVNESGLEREDSIDYHVGFGCDVKALEPLP